MVGGWGRDNFIAGNYIGTDASGFNSLPNDNNGVNIVSFQSTRVGTNGDGVGDLLERNVISGNDEDGIRIDDADRSLIAGNYIGVTANGLIPLGNNKRGVFITGGASDNVIGHSSSMIQSDQSLIQNVIKYNDDAGIGISDNSSLRNTISRNSIAHNADLGIDLDYDGVTANDNGDADIGSNNLLNFPVLSEVTWATDSTIVVSGFAVAGSTIEIFIADGDDNPSPLPGSFTNSFGEGQTFLFQVVEGSVDDLDSSIDSYTDDGTGAVTTKTQNKFEFTLSTAGMPIGIGTLITATATDVNGHTSEFSGVFEVDAVNCGTAIMNPHVMYYRARK